MQTIDEVKEHCRDVGKGIEKMVAGRPPYRTGGRVSSRAVNALAARSTARRWCVRQSGKNSGNNDFCLTQFLGISVIVLTLIYESPEATSQSTEGRFDKSLVYNFIHNLQKNK